MERKEVISIGVAILAIVFLLVSAQIPKTTVPTPDDLYDNIAKGEHLVFNQGPYITVLALEDRKVQRIVLFEIDGHFYRPMSNKTFDEDEARIKVASLDDVFDPGTDTKPETGGASTLTLKGRISASFSC